MTAESKLTSVNAHVEEYLDYYCSLSNPPGFAVLLKGAWGSGKTWFIEQYQKSLDARNIRVFYISLYGMNNTADIEDQFFQLLHPIMSSRGMAVTGIVLKGLLKGALKIDLTGDGQDDGTWNIQIPNIDLPKKLDNIDKSILIFDDLERCKIDLSSLLGYINFFVEHNDMKVILIAHEDKLLEDADYPSIKEKLIGKTLNILPIFEDALKSFVHRVEDVKIRDFLSNNFDIIKDLYQRTNYKNLRSLNNILLEFSRIFHKLPRSVQTHPEALANILKVLTALSIEIHQGTISPEDIGKLTTQYASFLNKKSPISTDENDQSQSADCKNRLNEVLDSHPFLDMYQVFPSLTWWKSFFSQGLIDLEELNLSISNSKYFQDENTPNWVKIWHFSELSDATFEALIKEVEIEFRNRVNSDLGVVTHVVGLFLMFSDAGIYRRTRKDILEDSISYVDELRRSSQLEPLSSYIALPEAIGSMFGGYQSLAFQGKETEEFKEFLAYLRNARKEVYDEEMPRKAQELIEVMCNDIFRFHEMICFDAPFERNNHPRYHEVPILNYIEASVFVDKTLEMKGKDTLYIYWALSERYKHDNINEKLVGELEWLKSIQKLLLDEVSHRQGKLSGYRLSLLNQSYLSGAIEKLSSKKSDLQI